MPEPVAVAHGQKAGDERRDCDDRPEGAGKSRDLPQDHEEGDDGTEYKTAAETETFLE